MREICTRRFANISPDIYIYRLIFIIYQLIYIHIYIYWQRVGCKVPSFFIQTAPHNCTCVWLHTCTYVCVCIAIVHILTVLIFVICYIQSFMVACKAVKGFLSHMTVTWTNEVTCHLHVVCIHHKLEGSSLNMGIIEFHWSK